MKKLVLFGDSIFDNAGYVDSGDSVLEQLNRIIPEKTQAALLAVDGDVTDDVHAQLKSTPADATHAFVSCGGNDALRMMNVLNEKVSTVGDALEMFTVVKAHFSKRYSTMLKAVSSKVENVTVCTIYNSIPNYNDRAITALSMFNDVILEEAFKLGFPVIDLRIICNEEADYSSVSPIEPSRLGSIKIANRILTVSNEHEFEIKRSIVYV